MTGRLENRCAHRSDPSMASISLRNSPGCFVLGMVVGAVSAVVWRSARRRVECLSGNSADVPRGRFPDPGEGESAPAPPMAGMRPSSLGTRQNLDCLRLHALINS